jgi:hypothetical protein
MFIQLGHELMADKGNEAGGSQDEASKDEDGRPTVLQTDFELPEVAGFQEADQEALGGGLEPSEQKQAQDGRQGHSQEQGPD